MAIWTVFALDVACGSCGQVIPAGAPVQLLTAKRLPRCAADATEPVNTSEVELERARLEFDRARESAPSVEPVARRPRTPQSFKQIADVKLPFDKKLAAVGDHE